MFKAPSTVWSEAEFLSKLQNELCDNSANLLAFKKEFQVWFVLNTIRT